MWHLPTGGLLTHSGTARFDHVPPKRTCSDSVTLPPRFGSTARRPRTMPYMLKPTMPSDITQKLNCSYQSTLRPTVWARPRTQCHLILAGWLLKSIPICQCNPPRLLPSYNKIMLNLQKCLNAIKLHTAVGE